MSSFGQSLSVKATTLPQNGVTIPIQKIALQIKQFTLLGWDSPVSEPALNTKAVSIQLGNFSCNLSGENRPITDAATILASLDKDGRKEFAFPNLLHFNGYSSKGDTTCRFTLGNGFLMGSLVTGNEEYIFEQAKNIDASLPANILILYNVKDVIANEQINCGVKDGPGAAARFMTNDPANKPLGICRTLEIAVLANNSTYVNHGANLQATVSYIAGIYNLSEANYTGQFNDDVAFRLTEMVVCTALEANGWPASDDINSNLSQFSNWGGATSNFRATNDLAAFWFYTRNFSNGAVGLAYVGHTCSSGGDACVREYGTGTQSMRCLLSHEMGHNFSASHDPEGASFIMAPAVNPSNVNFSPVSKTAINNYLASSFSTGCLTACASTPCEEQLVQNVNITYDQLHGIIHTTWTAETGFTYFIRWWEKGSADVQTATIDVGTSQFDIIPNCSAQYYRVEIAKICESGIAGVYTGVQLYLPGGGTASNGGVTTASTAAACPGNNAGTITVSDYVGAIQRWECSVNNGDTWMPKNVTVPVLDWENLTVTTQYRAVVKNGPCGEGYSTISTIIVAPSDGGTATGTATVCTGSNNGVVSLTGNIGDVNRWESSADNGNTWNNVGIGNNNTFGYTNLTATTLFRAFVQNGTCTEAVSSVAMVTVAAGSTGGTTAGSKIVCSGANNGTITLSGEVGNIIKWQQSINSGFSWTDIDQTQDQLTYTNLTSTTLFRAVVKNGDCSEAFSASTMIMVNQGSIGGTTSGSADVCIDGNTGNIDLAGYSGNILTWQWSDDNGDSWNNIFNTTETSITYTNLIATTQYRAVIQNGFCPVAFSTVSKVTVDALSIGGLTSGAADICSGRGLGTITLIGETGTVLNWQQSTDGANWTDINNNTHAQNWNALTSTTDYRAVIKNGACPLINSASSTITVGALVEPSVTLLLNPGNIAAPNSLIKAVAPGINIPASAVYEWYQNGDLKGTTTENTYDYIQVAKGISRLKVRVKIPSNVCVTVFDISSQTDTVATSMSIFPNPVTDRLVINGILPGTQVCLVDVNGKILYRNTANSNTLVISMLAYPAAPYYIRTLSPGNKKKSFKILKLK